MKKILDVNTAIQCEQLLGVAGAGEMCSTVVRAGGKMKGNYLLH